jgi:hypothetical protein
MAQITMNRWQLALFFYLLIIGILLITKPAFLFTADNQLKHWDVENSPETSILAPAIVFPLLALGCYYLSVWIDIMY